MKKFRKFLSVVLVALLVVQLGSGCIGAFASSDYTIVSPYEDVIWEGDNAWGAYKGTLHSHTTYSDATETLPTMIKEYYNQDYDFVANADHGIKPAKIMLHNTNLVYSIYPMKVHDQDVLETFVANSLWKDHVVSKAGKGLSFIVDGKLQLRLCTEGMRAKNHSDVYYVMHRRELGRGNEIPLWLFGFLY